MDTDAHVCANILKDRAIYRLTISYPYQNIRDAIEHIIASFKETIRGYSKQLYHYFLPKPQNNQTPKMYGIPKVHKKFTNLPPIRPIVAQSGSPLSPSSRFIDHTLQPLAQSYKDYIKNSTALINLLERLCPRNSLYPSIPQSECLQVVYEEMQKMRHLLIVDPNLIIRLSPSPTIASSLNNSIMVYHCFL